MIVTMMDTMDTMEGDINMNRSKILEYFDASKVTAPLHVVGCGAIGSHIAEQLARIGCRNIHLWDFDTVDSHNITNQMFTEHQIGQPKVLAVSEMMIDIDDIIEPEITLHTKGWTNEILNGYVFLCVDNIDLRREIVKKNQYNPNCIAFFDFRMRLTDAQHYFARRANLEEMKALLNSMDFTHEEAKGATPVSACNTELSIIMTVKIIAALGVNNFTKFCLDKPIKTMILIDLNMMTLDSFPMD